MSELTSNSKTQTYTMLFIGGVIVFTFLCLLIMNSRYDSLSRYPYRDQRSRQLIKQYLTSEEIEYIIEYSIEPNLFISFIQAEGFNIYHAAEYKKLSEVLWNESPQRIVDMIEETYEIIDTDTLIEFLQSTQGCGGLEVEKGYLSYERMMDYAEANERFTPGHNEHQLGLAIDFAVPGILHDDFHLTEQSLWLQDNAWKYGFVRTYTEGDEEITGQVASSTHYRYVGKELARMIHDSDSTFAKYA